ncbi:MAG: hypothetical protein ACK5JF_03125 [Oscillospiraceae bacterium]
MNNRVFVMDMSYRMMRFANDIMCFFMPMHTSPALLQQCGSFL